MVQNNSKCWDSIIVLFGVIKRIIEEREYKITETIRIIIVIEWSWKKINCSIRGE